MIKTHGMLRMVLLGVLLLPVAGAHADSEQPIKAETARVANGVVDKKAALQNLSTEVMTFLSAGRERAKVKVEIADTPYAQEHGLMGRTKLPFGTGMLFLFPESKMSYFWMKNTLVPLDIVFLDSDGRILKIHEGAKPGDKTIISSEFPVRAAVELPAGSIKKYKVLMGDLVVSPALDKALAEDARRGEDTDVPFEQIPRGTIAVPPKSGAAGAVPAAK